MAVTAPDVRRPRGWGWFAAWLAVGGGYALGFASLLSIGIFVLTITMAATIVLATRRGAARGLPGLLSGLSLPLFYIGYLNRSGPGTVCVETATSGSCMDEWSPWPFVAVGGALFAGGVLWFWVKIRAEREKLGEKLGIAS